MIFNPIDTYKSNIGGIVRRARFYLNRALLLPRGGAALDNIYCATVQKCGSQWINAVFSDERIRQTTKLAVYPQHHYDINDFRMKFPQGAFVPGLYIDYPLYDVFIDKPRAYKTFFVYRDPRDMAVSWYWSVKESHGINRGVSINRQRLNGMSEEEGLLYTINYLAPKFAAIRTWIELGEKDERVKLVRFEDLVAHPADVLFELFGFFGYEVEKSLIEEIAADYSKEKMRERESNRRTSVGESHYRKKSSSHKDMFNQRHYDLFRGVAGDLVERLGYK